MAANKEDEIKEERSKEREYYLLWYEYLKRSREYRDLCAQLKKTDLATISKRYRRRKAAEREDFYELESTYVRFGDIYDPSFSFNDWFENRQRRQMVAQQMGRQLLPPIEDFREYFQNVIMAEFVKEIVRNTKQKPSWEDLRDFILQQIKPRLYPPVSYVILNVSYSLPTLEKAIGELVGKKLEDPLVQRAVQHIRRMLDPSRRRLMLDELKRYLKVYDLKEVQKMKMKEIISTLEPHKDPNNAHVQRAYYNDVQNARQIIENAARGDFPGEY